MTEEPSYGARKFTHRMYFKFAAELRACEPPDESRRSASIGALLNLLLRPMLDVLSL
jgi:hypothetical protein